MTGLPYQHTFAFIYLQQSRSKPKAGFRASETVSLREESAEVREASQCWLSDSPAPRSTFPSRLISLLLENHRQGPCFRGTGVRICATSSGSRGWRVRMGNGGKVSFSPHLQASKEVRLYVLHLCFRVYGICVSLHVHALCLCVHMCMYICISEYMCMCVLLCTCEYLLCVHVHVSLHVCVVCLSLCVYRDLYVYNSVYVHVCASLCLRVHCVFVCSLCVHVCQCEGVFACTCAFCTCLCICDYLHAYFCMCICVYMYVCLCLNAYVFVYL